MKVFLCELNTTTILKSRSMSFYVDYNLIRALNALLMFKYRGAMYFERSILSFITNYWH